MKKTLTKILTLILAVITATAFIGCAENADTAKEENYTNRGYVNITNVKSNGISLFASGTQTTSTTGSLTREIVAIVYPEDAENKLVDWSVAWGTGASRINEDVKKYVTVTPSFDGSTIANVTCHKAFLGDEIYVTVTTRQGGYTASACCQYQGAPETLTIDMAGFTAVNDSGWNAKIYELAKGSTYSFDLVLNNTMGTVGPTFGKYKISILAYGGINTTKNFYDKSGNITSTTNEEISLEVVDAWDNNGSVCTKFERTISGGVESNAVQLRCSIENCKLKVEVLGAPSGFSAETGNQTGSAKQEFSSYIEGKIPYCAVTVTDTVSGLSQTINLRPYATAEGVSLNNGDDIIF